MDTGFYKVKRNNDSDIFNWDYILENGRKIQGRDLKDLRNKVAILGYKWEVIDSTLAEQSKSMDENNQKNNKTIVQIITPTTDQKIFAIELNLGTIINALSTKKNHPIIPLLINVNIVEETLINRHSFKSKT